MGVRSRTKHTPEPWELDIREYGFRIRMGSAVPYTGVYKPQHLIEWDPGVYYAPDYPETDAENRQYLEAEANARRIVACVNACEGIPTEALEAGVVRELVEALERCKEILDDLECECDSYHGFECSIHKDRELVRGVLAKVRGGGDS